MEKNSKLSIRNAGAQAVKAMGEVPSGNTLLGVINLQMVFNALGLERSLME